MAAPPGPAAGPALAPILSLVLAVALGGCQGGNGGGVVRIVPKAVGQQATGASASPSRAGIGPPGKARRSPSIPRYTVLQVLNVNLDQDADEEQVIAVKDLTDVGSPVRLLVVDADPGRGTYYFQSWDADTSATDTRVFPCRSRDVIGDHSLQIVANGMNDAGKLTLDVFRARAAHAGKGTRSTSPSASWWRTRSPSRRASGLTATPRTRSRGRASPSWRTCATPIRRTSWTSCASATPGTRAEGRYIPGAAEKIPGEEVQQAQLKALYTSSGRTGVRAVHFRLLGPGRNRGSPARRGIRTVHPRLRSSAGSKKISISSGQHAGSLRLA